MLPRFGGCLRINQGAGVVESRPPVLTLMSAAGAGYADGSTPSDADTSAKAENKRRWRDGRIHNAG
jgi:hypothetical protein